MPKTLRSNSRSRRSSKTLKDANWRGTLYVKTPTKWNVVPDAKIDEEMQLNILDKLEKYVKRYKSKNVDYSVRANCPAGLIYVSSTQPKTLHFKMNKKDYMIEFNKQY